MSCWPGTSTDVDGGEKYVELDIDGGTLFFHFARNKVKEEAPGKEVLLDTVNMTGTKPPQNLKSNLEKLHQIEELFDESDQRMKVKENAMKLGLNVRKEELQQLLHILLDNGTDEHLLERIIVVFFFCYDYLMRLLHKGDGGHVEFMLCCQESISEVLDPVVIRDGGWSHVLETAVEKGRLAALKAKWTSVKSYLSKKFSFFLR